MTGDGTLPFPIARVVAQRRPMDCGVATLAMLLHLDYDQVWTAMEMLGLECRRGLSHRKLARIAAALGRGIVRQRHYDPHAVLKAIAHVKYDETGSSHYVLLSRGVVIDPADAQVWRWLDYLAAKGCRPGSVLVGAAFGGEPLLDLNEQGIG